MLQKLSRRCFSAKHPKTYRDGNIINPHVGSVSFLTQNEPGVLRKIIEKFGDRVNMRNIESDFSTVRSTEKTRIKISYESVDGAYLPEKELLRMIQEYCTDAVAEPIPQVPNFPIELKELDQIGKKLMSLDDNVDRSLPLFTDPEYRKRRDEIALMNRDYKMLQDIPIVEYTRAEKDLWKSIYDQLRPRHLKHGCKVFNDNFKILEDKGLFSRDALPQLGPINEYLIKRNNWRLKPVSGILSSREYLNSLAFRTFCCTQYIRHTSIPNYTPEPDLVHEMLGHVAMFCDPVFCDLSQMIGILSLGVSDALIAQIGTIYWYTIEFGLCKEKNEFKFYGAGVASSISEIDNAFNGKPEMKKLDLKKQYPTIDPLIQKIQPFYYYIDEFWNCLNQLQELHSQTHKVFSSSMNEDATKLFIDKKIQVYNEDEEPSNN